MPEEIIEERRHSIGWHYAKKPSDKAVTQGLKPRQKTKRRLGKARMMTEKVMELARPKKYPSRFGSVFLFPEATDIPRELRPLSKRQLLEVDVSGMDNQSVSGPYDVFTVVGTWVKKNDIQTAIDIAGKYWNEAILHDDPVSALRSADMDYPIGEAAIYGSIPSERVTTPL